MLSGVSFSDVKAGAGTRRLETVELPETTHVSRQTRTGSVELEDVIKVRNDLSLELHSILPNGQYTSCVSQCDWFPALSVELRANHIAKHMMYIDHLAVLNATLHTTTHHPENFSKPSRKFLENLRTNQNIQEHTRIYQTIPNKDSDKW